MQGHRRPRFIEANNAAIMDPPLAPYEKPESRRSERPASVLDDTLPRHPPLRRGLSGLVQCFDAAELAAFLAELGLFLT